MSFDHYWNERKLSDLIDVKHGYAFQGEYFSDNETSNVLLTPGNFKVGGGFNSNKYKFYREDAEIPKEFILKNGDLIVTMTDLSKNGDTLGYPAIVPNIQGKRFLHNQRIGKVVINSNIVDTRFLFYSLCTKQYRHHILATATGSTVKHTAPKRILEYVISLPTLIEQKEIASLLSSFDNKIELNNAINKNLEEIAQALFKRWFVDFEFPNENGEPYKSSGGEFEESEFGLIPKGWRVGLLSELGEVVGGATPSKNKEEYYTTQGIPWITPKDLSINKNKYISRGQIDITEDGFKNSSTKLVPKGTILFSSRAPIGYIAISKNEMTTNQGFKSLIPFKHIGTEFLYYVLKFNTEMIESRASGSTFKEISGSEMKRIPVLIPISRIIEQFNEVVEPLGKLVEKCESENDSLILLRDSLLPKLMSGEIRVPLEQEYVGTASLPMAAENKAQYSTT